MAFPGASFGFVGGSGTNGCLAKSNYRDGFLINLECGRLPVFPQAEILKIMAGWGWLPNSGETNLAEFYTGGDFLPLILKACFSYLADLLGRDLTAYLGRVDARILDWFIKRETKRIKETLGIELTEEELTFGQEASRRIMARAGQTIGVLWLAMAKAAGFSSEQKPIIPDEGSILLRREGVLKTAKATFQEIWGKEPKVVEVEGMLGVATYALWEGGR